MQAPPLGPEQGFQDHGPAGADLARRHGARVFGRFACPGGRRRNAGPRQQKRGRRLVDAALDGARVVAHGHAKIVQGMEQAEPERYLFEAAGGDGAHEGAVGQRPSEAGQIEAMRPGAGIEGTVAEGDAHPVGAARRQRRAQPVGVPLRPLGEDRYPLNRPHTRRRYPRGPGRCSRRESCGRFRWRSRSPRRG